MIDSMLKATSTLSWAALVLGAGLLLTAINLLAVQVSVLKLQDRVKVLEAQVQQYHTEEEK